MENIPDPPLLCIFTFLPIADRIRAVSVCKRWKHLLDLKILRRNLDFTTSSDYFNEAKIHHDTVCERRVNRPKVYECFCFWRRKMKLTRYGSDETRRVCLPKCIDVAAIEWLTKNRFTKLTSLQITLPHFEMSVDFRIFPKHLSTLTIKFEDFKDGQPWYWSPCNLENAKNLRCIELDRVHLCRKNTEKLRQKFNRLRKIRLSRSCLWKRLSIERGVDVKYERCVRFVPMPPYPSI